MASNTQSGQRQKWFSRVIFEFVLCSNTYRVY